jgi:histone H1/5
MSKATSAPAKKTVAKKPAKAMEHPPVATMVSSAISELKDRKGSSLAAIKKHIAANNKVYVAKLAPFIKKFFQGSHIIHREFTVKSFLFNVLNLHCF